MAVANRTPSQELVARVRSDEFQQQVALALPEGMPARRFVRATVTALMQNPDIAQAEPASVFTSLIRAAQDGLLPDGREAALVVFGGKAVYMPMVAGFRKIAAEHGWAIRSDVVYKNDFFEYELGLEPVITHRPARLDMERGRPIGAYAVGTHRDGRKQVEVLSLADIEKVRAVSRSGQKGPWVDWFERMCEKTAARRLFAKLALGDRDERVPRVLEASGDPEVSERLMYGPPQTDVEAFDAQQAGGGATSPPWDGPQTPPPAPNPDPEAEAMREQANIAGQVTFEVGKWKGHTIAEVAAMPKDRSYLSWILRQSDHPLLSEVRLYCRLYCVDLAEQAAAQMAVESQP